MLSQDIDNAAASINGMLDRKSEGHYPGKKVLLGLQSNLRSLADQARQMEAQIAPGSAIIDNVTSLTAGKVAASR